MAQRAALEVQRIDHKVEFAASVATISPVESPTEYMPKSLGSGGNPENRADRVSRSTFGPSVLRSRFCSRVASSIKIQAGQAERAQTMHPYQGVSTHQ